MTARKTTDQLIDFVEQGMLTWEQIARSCMYYMSEQDVNDMAHVNELIVNQNEEE